MFHSCHSEKFKLPVLLCLLLDYVVHGRPVEEFWILFYSILKTKVESAFKATMELQRCGWVAGEVPQLEGKF